MKHTAGKWLISTHMDNEDIVIRNNKGIIANLSVDKWPELSEDEIEANAMLIVEAANIAHKTGKTPRQLADENEANGDLLQACIALMACFQHKDGDTKGNKTRTAIFKDCPEFRDAATAALNAINKALNR